MIEDVIQAIQAADGNQWPIADAIAAMPEKDDEGNKWTQQRISNEIWERLGVEWKPNTISHYRVTAEAFPNGRRLPHQTFSIHVELRRCPEKLTEWAARHPDPSDRLTVETARNMRGGTSAGTSGRATTGNRLKRVVGQLETLADEDPSLILEALEFLIQMIRAKYSKRLKISK